MFQNALELQPHETLKADLCIIGSGPAGLSLAGEFIDSQTHVVVLEAGNLNVARGDDNADHVGGRSTRWHVKIGVSEHGIRMVPLTDADFEARPFPGCGGWPIRRPDIEPFYRRAHSFFGLEPHGYSLDEWVHDRAQALPLEGGRIKTGIYQFGDGEVVSRRRVQDVGGASNITICYNARAVELCTNEAGTHVHTVRCLSAPGRDIFVEARCIVIAGGGLTEAPLLLASNRVQPSGLGNAHDVVGRYFMDHPLLLGGEWIPRSRAIFDDATLYDIHTVHRTIIMGHLALSDNALRAEPILNLSMMLYPRPSGYQILPKTTARQEIGVAAARRIRSALRGRDQFVPLDTARAVLGADAVLREVIRRAATAHAELNRGGWSASSRHSTRYASFEVLHQAEQAPHWDNRLVLSEDRDAFGQREVRLEWRLHDEDAAAIVRSQQVFATEIERAGLGEFKIAQLNGGPVIRQRSTGHFMGATRMSADPRTGVVDANCKVHGIDNVFISSGSVFTTGGFANPTLTIVALSLRLAEHLRGTLH